MNILLIGATGFSGKIVLQELLNDGHRVTAVTRNKTGLETVNSQLVVQEGNVQDSDFIRDVLQGQDAVINCLGIGGKGNGKPNALVSSVTRILVNEMESNGPRRLMCMSNHGVGDSKKDQPWFFRKIILPYFMKWLSVIIDDKEIMEPIITNSKLEWSIFRFPNITNRPAKRTIRTSSGDKKIGFSITNVDLARFMVAELHQKKYLFQSPSVSN